MPCDGKNDSCQQRRQLLQQLKCLISTMERKKPCEWDAQECCKPLCPPKYPPPCPRVCPPRCPPSPPCPVACPKPWTQCQMSCSRAAPGCPPVCKIVCPRPSPRPCPPRCPPRCPAPRPPKCPPPPYSAACPTPCIREPRRKSSRPEPTYICCPPQRCRSYELRASVMNTCQCPRRNGLQDKCTMQDCQGYPECMTKLFPICEPGQCALRKLCEMGGS